MNKRPSKPKPSPRRASRAEPRPERERQERICVGQIGAPHGVRGEVRLRSFTAEPEAIAGYGPLQTEDGRVVEILSVRPAKEHFVATLRAVHDRDEAARLANVMLYVPRERLPQLDEPDEFYHADLIGLAVVDRAGEKLGTVEAIHNSGAGDLIEVRAQSGVETELLPFDEINVPAIEIAAGRIVVDPPRKLFKTRAGGR